MPEIRDGRHPVRIWATVNGVSTRLPDGVRQLIGGWSEDKDRPGAAEYALTASMPKDVKGLIDDLNGHSRSSAKHGRDDDAEAFARASEALASLSAQVEELTRERDADAAALRLASERADALERVTAERDEHLRMKNKLVLVAYPAMDDVAAVKAVLAEHAHPSEVEGLSLAEAVGREIERAWAASRYNADQYTHASVALRAAEASLAERDRIIAEKDKALEFALLIEDHFDRWQFLILFQDSDPVLVNDPDWSDWRAFRSARDRRAS